MKFALVVLCLVALAGCCGGAPAMTIRSPLLFDQEPATVAGPRMVQAPTYYAPSYAPAVSAPAGCAPAGLPPGYAPTR